MVGRVRLAGDDEHFADADPLDGRLRDGLPVVVARTSSRYHPPAGTSMVASNLASLMIASSFRHSPSLLPFSSRYSIASAFRAASPSLPRTRTVPTFFAFRCTTW